MALPELVRKSAEKILARYCAAKEPPGIPGQGRIRFNIRDDHITLYAEEQGAFSDPPCRRTASPVAQFRYNHDLGQWTLHYPDRDHTWRFYLNAGPALDLTKLLRHLDEDPLGIFWDQ